MTAEPTITVEPVDGGYVARCSCGWTSRQNGLARARVAGGTHCTSHQRVAAVLEDIEWMVETQVGLSEAARRLGYRDGACLERYLMRHDRHDLAQALNERDWLSVTPARKRWAA